MIKKRKLSQQMNGVLTIYGLLLVVFAVMCLVSESFRSLYNITNLITQCVPLACVALGQTLVIISGGIDMSVGSTISVCTCVAAKLMNTDSPAQVAFGAAAVVLTGVAVGLINGAGINFAKVPPMITTLCTSTALSGVALWILPMAGGVGLLSGTVAGAFLIGMLSNIMNSLAVNQFYQYVVKGALLVLAMVIYSVSKLMEVKRHAK